MFDQGKNHYRSDITLGEKYVDNQTGITGTATGIFFFQHACERVSIEFVTNDGVLRAETFDAPRLSSVKTRETAGQSRTGGPRPDGAQFAPTGRSDGAR